MKELYIATIEIRMVVLAEDVGHAGFVALDHIKDADGEIARARTQATLVKCGDKIDRELVPWDDDGDTETVGAILDRLVASTLA